MFRYTEKLSDPKKEKLLKEFKKKYDVIKQDDAKRYTKTFFFLIEREICEFIDHTSCFIDKYNNVLIVSQPYLQRGELDKLYRFAAKNQFKLTVLDSSESWYYPDNSIVWFFTIPMAQWRELRGQAVSRLRRRAGHF